MIGEYFYKYVWLCCTGACNTQYAFIIVLFGEYGIIVRHFKLRQHMYQVGERSIQAFFMLSVKTFSEYFSTPLTQVKKVSVLVNSPSDYTSTKNFATSISPYKTTSRQRPKVIKTFTVLSILKTSSIFRKSSNYF